ncbi:hypothetical protein BXZ70DRAFT_1015307 [Cristinia sonorae]|uniref:Uncharacterized protein n=1 Tax=Cristinia sonorae TaxID=1940300 RepID=A0A8K0V2I5_9AGAR|nr:hypothetical protein BXZ70DRAFT_1015307 [Cristinia sonorae]
MFSNRVFNFAIAAAGLGLVSAQLSGLSDQCKATLTSVVITPSSSCLNAQALVALVTASSDASLVGPIDNWLTGLCAKPACSNDTLTSIVNTVLKGCNSDLQSFGASFDPTVAVKYVLEVYPTARKVVCLTDSNANNELCVTETLTNVQNSTGTTLSANGVESLFGQIMAGQLPNVPASVICTDCTKAAFNIIETDFPSIATSSLNVNGHVSDVCGADFIDGANPTGVSQSATNSSQSVTATGDASLAVPAGIFGGLLSSLVALGSGMAMLV